MVKPCVIESNYNNGSAHHPQFTDRKESLGRCEIDSRNVHRQEFTRENQANCFLRFHSIQFHSRDFGGAYVSVREEQMEADNSSDGNNFPNRTVISKDLSPTWNNIDRYGDNNWGFN